MSTAYETSRIEWAAREELAERMIPLIGRLYREHGVVPSILGRRLLGRSPAEILKAHRFTRKVGDQVLSPEKTLAVLEGFARIVPGPASIDIARLVTEFDARGGSYEDGSLDSFLRDELAEVMSAEPSSPTDVVLYGFGRIGRLVARLLIAHQGSGDGLRLRAVVLRRGSSDDLLKRAELLKRDSVHGAFAGTVEVDEENETILANGTLIQVIYANDPAAIDYTAYDIHDAIVVDNTGRWRDQEGLNQHLRATGRPRVLLTAPGKGDIKNIVFGVNSDDISDARPDPLGGLVHDERDHAGARGDRRGLRGAPRSRRDGALVHERPEPHRQLPHRRPARTRGVAEHGDHGDRCSEGCREGFAAVRRAS